MNVNRFIRNNLIHYWRKNLLLALGVSISAAVLTGALIVGDSVKYSLNMIVDQRLGSVTHILKAGDRYFTNELADRVSSRLNIPISSLLLQEGSAVADGGAKRISHIQVLGVDQGFDQMAGLDQFYSTLSGDSIILSRNLATRLNLTAGDEVLLRIQKASLIPLNAPFVSDAESVVPLRAVIKAIADEAQLGRFNLRVSQIAPFNVFVSQSRLQELMDFEGRINVMLVQSEPRITEEEINQAIREQFTTTDAGLKLKEIVDLNLIEVTSDQIFIEDDLAEILGQVAGSGKGILTYFVNQFRTGTGVTPYSFVSTLPDQWLRPDEIIINTWLASDLSVRVGDSLQVTYFKVGPLRELTEETSLFTVKSIVALDERFGDRTLMPDLPGLSDAGNCRDWNTGVPIDLESIRDKDEDYWDEYGGIPKAYVSVSRGIEMWNNRFGSYTSFRYDADSLDVKLLESSILSQLDPSMLGFALEDVRSRGDDAAGSGVDFSQLFGGLSFFLLAGGILLTVLLFLLNIGSRDKQLRTLVTMGIPVRMIRRIMMVESMMVTLVGSLTGLLLSLLYNKAVFYAMNGVWKDVVRTEMMHLDVKAGTLATGLVISLVISVIALYFPLNRLLRKQFSAHKPGTSIRRNSNLSQQKIMAGASAGTGVVALVLIATQLFNQDVINGSLFFAAGGLLLISSVCFFIWFLGRVQQPSESMIELQRLSWKNAIRNRTRSLSIVILFAIGAFLVISTGSNRKDLFVDSEEKSSGTGGFLYYAESTVPVLQHLNDPRIKSEYGLSDGYSIIQLRKADGDDASCLNLNKVINPQILGVDAETVEGRYAFVTRSEYLDENQPWKSLDQELPGGLIPAIADETVIKWSLGLEVGDTLHYVNSNGGTMKLLLIGGLAPSVFQGNVIISNTRFLEEFPESSGTHVFLVDGSTADSAVIRDELVRGLRDLGWDMELTATRLTMFNSVTNTYLSIFMVMGALGLLVGTFGMVVVLFRSIQERKQEIALLKAVGYRRKDIRKLIIREYLMLLMVGIGTGFITAIVATLPSILSPNTGISMTSILIWLGILVANGWFWVQLVTRLALRNSTIYSSLRND